ncbi:hypothetical protein G6F61_014591 [Rhizopus arrhizus]|nr:hypothetical protein G6F61_014591 [Rhizopus arrhizus]
MVSRLAACAPELAGPADADAATAPTAASGAASAEVAAGALAPVPANRRASAASALRPAGTPGVRGLPAFCAL